MLGSANEKFTNISKFEKMSVNKRRFKNTVKEQVDPLNKV